VPLLPTGARRLDALACLFAAAAPPRSPERVSRARCAAGRPVGIAGMLLPDHWVSRCQETPTLSRTCSPHLGAASLFVRQLRALGADPRARPLDAHGRFPGPPRLSGCAFSFTLLSFVTRPRSGGPGVAGLLGVGDAEPFPADEECCARLRPGGEEFREDEILVAKPRSAAEALVGLRGRT
jgi:hypothetical protein